MSQPPGRYEGRSYIEDSGIRHIEGCHGTAGCRCEGYRELNPQLFPSDRYIPVLRGVREHLSERLQRAVDNAIRTNNSGSLDSVADSAFYELLEKRNAHPRGSSEFDSLEGLIQPLLNLLGATSMR